MLGKKLYAPIDINRAMSKEFQTQGWSASRKSYWMTKDANLIRKTMTIDQAKQKQVI